MNMELLTKEINSSRQVGTKSNIGHRRTITAAATATTAPAVTTPPKSIWLDEAICRSQNLNTSFVLWGKFCRKMNLFCQNFGGNSNETNVFVTRLNLFKPIKAS